jgi:hypothetical protein
MMWPVAYSKDNFHSSFDSGISSSKSFPAGKTILRTKSREKFLLKMFSIREMLKWKYNYFEANPHEHKLYYECSKTFNFYRKSKEFRKMWRLKMDELYYEETTMATQILKQDETFKMSCKNEEFPVADPSRLLVNYDRQVVNMIRRIKDEFNFYLQFPKSYPQIDDEKRRFLNDYYGDGSSTENSFQFYWESRIGTLCDLAIKKEKEVIREDWKALLPAYYESYDSAYPEEVQVLLKPDDDSGSDDIDIDSEGDY